MSNDLVNPRKRRAETQEEAWVADEDRFVLQQAKKKAALRVKAGRARPIDQLAVILRTLDPPQNGFDEEDQDDELLVVTPEAVFENLEDNDLVELEKEIDTYIALERSKSNHEYWQTMKLVCRDRRQEDADSHAGQGVSAVAAQLDRVLGPKNLKELEALEKQVRQKLRSDEAIDVDYWENLLKRLAVHKARAQLRKVTMDVMGARMKSLRDESRQEARAFRDEVRRPLAASATVAAAKQIDTSSLDPDSCLRISTTDRKVPVVQHVDFCQRVEKERKRLAESGYAHVRAGSSKTAGHASKGEGQTTVTGTAYEREVARGLGEDEEVFETEEAVTAARKPAWADKYVPRKPRYFNRVQLGYEWNKYNQTHYDQENPPPKVVQGYKFNIFYPDLIDTAKAPTYRIERENGRRRGQTLAPAGEEDTCIIRFVAGPPYLELAFRIVDREWDYSAKRERGFKSSFDKGILQLHFQFKKIYYRK
ncbi:hypothetical protein CAC42_1408 [Sphaceloma murrayae]|uniref:Splicing factor Cactin n=1 Tax=Sphaceloma murrayae TaxID=2082308 RepID=A0A2K1QFM5_9PEZI|nr:hypothetical protein CAC42_1408 [Sphaceloma murrayae]